MPPRRINEIVLGKRGITADTAVRLARYFGNDAAYWMKLQTDYDIALATNTIGIHLYTIEPDGRSDPVINTPEHEVPRSSSNPPKSRNKIKRRLLR